MASLTPWPLYPDLEKVPTGNWTTILRTPNPWRSHYTDRATVDVEFLIRLLPYLFFIYGTPIRQQLLSEVLRSSLKELTNKDAQMKRRQVTWWHLGHDDITHHNFLMTTRIKGTCIGSVAHVTNSRRCHMSCDTLTGETDRCMSEVTDLAEDVSATRCHRSASLPLGLWTG